MPQILLAPALRILPPADSLPGEKFITLTPGEIFEGTILERKEPDQLLVRIKGRDLWARSQVPLPGEGKISLQVESVEPQVLLRFLTAVDEGGSGFLGPLKKTLGGGIRLDLLAERLSALAKTGPDLFPAEVQKGMEELKAALAEYAPPFLTDPRALREKVSQSGLFWENRLQALVEKGGAGDLLQAGRQDLKGLLSKLKSLYQNVPALEGRNDPALAGAKEALQALEPYLQRIEAYQLLNQRYGDSAEKWLLLLPLWFGGKMQFLELSGGFSRREGGSSAAEEISLLFLLSLPEAGKVKVEVAIRKDDLFCRIHSAVPSFREEIHRNLSELEDRLRTLGFRPALCVFEGPPEEEQEAIVSRLDESGENLVSLVV